MVDQTAVRNAGKPGETHQHGHGDGVVSNLADLINDFATLGELQAELAAVDIKESAARAVFPVVVAVSALALVVASLPVILLGVAHVLSRAVNLQLGWAILLTGLAALVAGGLLALVYYKRVTTSLEPLRRSREEFIRNLSWVRTVLVYSGRSYPKRRS